MALSYSSSTGVDNLIRALKRHVFPLSQRLQTVTFPMVRSLFPSLCCCVASCLLRVEDTNAYNVFGRSKYRMGIGLTLRETQVQSCVFHNFNKAEIKVHVFPHDCHNSHTSVRPSLHRTSPTLRSQLSTNTLFFHGGIPACAVQYPYFYSTLRESTKNTWEYCHKISQPCP